jgi:lipopolysaccharide export LptBFGC system permease protein LptF
MPLFDAFSGAFLMLFLVLFLMLFIHQFTQLFRIPDSGRPASLVGGTARSAVA